MIEKILSMVMMPFGLLIVLEELGLFGLDIFFDKALIGAVFMMIVQLITLISLMIHHKNMRIVNSITFLILIFPAVIYLITYLVELPFQESLPLIIGVMMFVEGTYAFH